LPLKNDGKGRRSGILLRRETKKSGATSVSRRARLIAHFTEPLDLPNWIK